MLAGDSRFDRWYFGGDTNALSASEQAGFRWFISSNCNACHLIGEGDATFTDNRFHNTGIHEAKRLRSAKPISVQLAPGVNIEVDPDSLANVSEPEQQDEGRFEVSGDPRDRHAFKTPSLRNVALTAPYMHDGSIATLEEVIEYYAAAYVTQHNQPPVHASKWSKREKAELLEFLRGLTAENVSHLSQGARAER